MAWHGAISSACQQELQHVIYHECKPLLADERRGIVCTDRNQRRSISIGKCAHAPGGCRRWRRFLGHAPVANGCAGQRGHGISQRRSAGEQQPSCPERRFASSKRGGSPACRLYSQMPNQTATTGRRNELSAEALSHAMRRAGDKQSSARHRDADCQAFWLYYPNKCAERGDFTRHAR